MLVDLDLREHPSRAIEKTNTQIYIYIYIYICICIYWLEKEFCRRLRQNIYIYILNVIEHNNYATFVFSKRLNKKILRK